MGFFDNIGTNIEEHKKILQEIYVNVDTGKLKDIVPSPSVHCDKDRMSLVIYSNIYPSIHYKFNFFEESAFAWLSEIAKEKGFLGFRTHIYRHKELVSLFIFPFYKQYAPKWSIKSFTISLPYIESPVAELRDLRCNITKYLTKLNKEYVRKKYDFDDVIKDLESDINRIKELEAKLKQ